MLRSFTSLPPPLVLAIAIGASPPADADVYKCAGERRAPMYQDAPCAAGRELRNFQADPPAMSVVPFRDTSATSPVHGEAQGRSRGHKNQKADADGASPPPRHGTVTTRTRKGGGNASERKFLHMGMSEAEVVARIGTPDLRASGNRGGARWSYLPHVNDPQTITTLTFANGVISNIERRMVQ